VNGPDTIITPHRRLVVYRFSFLITILFFKEILMKYVGIDLHTNRFTCCYLSDSSKEKQTETFDLNLNGLNSFYSTIDKNTYVLIEATINTFSFAALFKDLVKEVIVANTYQLKSIGICRRKSERKLERFPRITYYLFRLICLWILWSN